VGATAELRLARTPGAVPHARRYVAAAVRAAGYDEEVSFAELAVTELVTNAVLHGRSPIAVRVLPGASSVRIEVADGSRISPVRAAPGRDAMTGRGLDLVEAIATRWGVEIGREGKVVWCDIAHEPAEDPMPREAARSVDSQPVLTPGSSPQAITVHLGDVPTDLLIAAKGHIENLVREFTLAASGAATGTSSAVPTELAALIEDVVTGWAAERLEIKRQALAAAAAGRERTRLTLRVAPSAAEVGRRYLAALDQADDYARRAELLTLETPPEHRVFRHWYIEAIIEQINATIEGRPARPVEPFEDVWNAERAELDDRSESAERR
jgi:anti-sigma regulatory factor (Ser/Thr protein kinase)